MRQPHAIRRANGSATVEAATTKRCAIYTRKSTTIGLDDDFNSLDSQRKSCEAYVRAQPGWEVIDRSYDDGGFTGANTDRPAFQQLMADVDAGNIDVVVVYKVDRLSRSILDFAKVMERFNKAGASFVSVTQNFTTADAMGRLTLNVLLSFAQFEREMIADRTRDKIANQRRSGRWAGGAVPFGYQAVDRKLVINEFEANTVRVAFELFLQHREASAVARELNSRQFQPRGMKSRPSRAGNRWSKDSVARLLRNPIYGGWMPYGGELFPGEHAAIVGDDNYKAVRSIIDAPGRVVTGGRRAPEYILKGLLFCGRCNGSMCPASSQKKGKRSRYYRCSTRDKLGREVCAAKELPADAIEQYVVARLTESTLDTTFTTYVDTLIHKRIENERAALLKVRADLPSRIAQHAADASKFTEQLPGLSGRAQRIVHEKTEASAQRLVAAEKALVDTERRLADLRVAEKQAEWAVSALANIDRVWEAMSHENRGRLLRAVVASVRVDEAQDLCHIELVNFASFALTAAA